MRRMTGRHLGMELALTIASLPDDELFSASEVAFTKYDPKLRRTEYERLKNKLWKLANRNGLPDNPDNCARDEEGDPLLNEHARPVLQKGERYPRYQGTTWKGLLYDEDWAAVKNAPKEATSSEIHQVQETPPSSPVSSPTASAPKENATASVTPLSPDSPELPEIVGKAFKAYTWRRMRRFLFGPLGIGILFISSSLLLPTAIGGIRHGFDAVYAVFAQKGTAAALQMAISSKEDSLEMYFGSGWLYFMARDTHRARYIMNDILNDPSTSLHYRAKALYVLGTLELTKKEFDKAESYFNQSISAYEGLGMSEGVGRNLIELAKVNWRQNRTPEAFLIAHEAKEILQSGGELTKLFMRLYFETSDYEKSIAYAHRLIAEDERVFERITAYLHLGYTYTILGNDPLALEFNAKASALIESTEDKNLRFYRFVNEIAYGECKQARVDELESLVKDYAFKYEDYIILDQLKDAKALCAVDQF